MVGEGDEGVVGGEGVPPGGEGGLPRPVPEHSHALALPPENTHTKSDDTSATFTATQQVKTWFVFYCFYCLEDDKHKGDYCHSVVILFELLKRS